MKARASDCTNSASKFIQLVSVFNLRGIVTDIERERERMSLGFAPRKVVFQSRPSKLQKKRSSTLTSHRMAHSLVLRTRFM